MKRFPSHLPHVALTSSIIVVCLLVFAPVRLSASNRTAVSWLGGHFTATAMQFPAYSVNTVADDDDASVNDGRCDTDGDPSNGDQCTLRAAIQQGNVAGFPDINFALPPNSTIVLTHELDQIRSLKINGPGSALLTIARSSAAGTANFRIFTTQIEGRGLHLKGVTITNGRAPDGNDEGNGFLAQNGAHGGGIWARGTELILNDVVVAGNRSGNGGNGIQERPGGSGGGGGGISSASLITLIVDSVITNNRAGDGGNGGTAVEGGGAGGIVASGNLTIINTTISNNVAGNGGNATGSSAGAGGSAGGLRVGGVITIVDSAIIHNTSGRGGQSATVSFGGMGGDGGGIHNSGRLTLINTTISSNKTGGGGVGSREGNGGGSGGGISNSHPQMILANCTVTDNETAGNYGGSGGGIESKFGTTILKNTIVANNKVATGGMRDGEGPDVFGKFTSQDYNLIENVSGGTVGGETVHNIIGLDPRLGPLANNGGATQTHALLLASPAIDAGSNANLEPDTFDVDADGNVTETIPFDQRGSGFHRVLQGKVDIGALESSPQQLPPQLLLDSSGPSPNQAAALQSTLLVRDPFPIQETRGHFNGSDANTRVTIFVANIAVAPGETTSSVIVNIVDSANHSFDLSAEALIQVAGSNFMQVTFRLPTDVMPGTCNVKVKQQAQESNTGTFRIM